MPTAKRKQKMVPITVRIPDLLHGKMRAIVKTGWANTLRDMVESGLSREVDRFEDVHGSVQPLRRNLIPGRRVQARNK